VTFDRNKFCEIVRRHARFLSPAEDLPTTISLQQLGLDSVGSIDLLLDLEQAFECHFPDTLLTANTFQNATTLELALRSCIQSCNQSAGSKP
jgi:acyl carrier protein